MFPTEECTSTQRRQFNSDTIGYLTISLWEENFKNIWANKTKPNMDSQNHCRIR